MQVRVGGPGQRADPFDIILCDAGRTLPLAHAQPARVGRRRGTGVPWERVTASPTPRKSPAPPVHYAARAGAAALPIPAAPASTGGHPGLDDDASRLQRRVTAYSSQRENDFNVEC